jgi:hypothetical protein
MSIDALQGERGKVGHLMYPLICLTKLIMKKQWLRYSPSFRNEGTFILTHLKEGEFIIAIFVFSFKNKTVSRA